jgi:alpha-tubulin suppressor-like RCC1 family protein
MQGVQEGVKVLSAEIGAYTGALVTEDGQLYAFGFGRFGGHGLGRRDVAVPTRVRGGLENERVILVRIGNCFAAVLTVTGRVWTFGSSNRGQLGTGEMRTRALPPHLLEGRISQFKIVQLSCGGVHTIALTESGRIFSWGCNDTGQLGLGDRNDRYLPTVIEGEVSGLGDRKTFSDKKVVFVSSSTFSNAVVTDKGEIWVWGSKFSLWYGQETINNIVDSTILVYPRNMRPVKNMENVSAVACNDNFTLALNTNKSGRGEIWVWGNSESDSNDLASPLGDGSWNQALEPTLIQGELQHRSVASVSCGQFHVCALTEEGLVFTWGSRKAHGHGEWDVLSPKVLTKSDSTLLPPVGRCKPLALQKALAFAMSSHPRLGSNSQGQVMKKVSCENYEQTQKANVFFLKHSTTASV